MANKKKKTKNAHNKHKNKNRNSNNNNNHKKQSSSTSTSSSSDNTNNNNNNNSNNSNSKANEMDIFGTSDRAIRVEIESKSVHTNGVQPNKAIINGDCGENSANIATLNTMVKPHGLTNLGNTCYFNSMLQVLSQTHILYELLNERSNSGVEWIAKAVNGNNEFTEQLHTILPDCFSLNTSLIKNLREMRSTNGKVVTPSQLLKEICNKWSQFNGYHQQDSHELLRCVLDSLKSEEIRRQRKAILQALDLSDKAFNYDDDTKAKCKSYAAYSTHTLIDSVFGGLMLASITCSGCGHTSQNFEPFFDISLPIVEDSNSCLKTNKVQNKTIANEVESNDTDQCLIDTDAKALTPKERRARRQQKKAAKRMNKTQPIKIDVNHRNDTNNDETKTNGELIEVNTDNTVNNDEWGNNFDETGDSNAVVMTCENQNFDTNIVDENWDLVPLFNDIELSPINNVNNISNDNVVNNEEADGCDDSFNLDVLYDNSNDNYSAVDEKIDEKIDDKPKSESDDSDAQLYIAFDDINGENASSIESDFVHLSISDRDKLTRTHHEFGSVTEKRKSLIKSTLLSLSNKQCDTGYEEKLPNFLLIKCLSKFMSSEMLVESNKYLCDICTKNNDNIKKYCDASKQVLIAIPPPILTLHLKRFEADGYHRKANLRKINQYVSFPSRFDLSPFVSKIYNFIVPLTKLKTADRIIYSLYGVIEHSGSLRSGHYTAYVKVRNTNTNTNNSKFYLMEPFLHKIDYALKLIEENDYNIDANNMENTSNGKLSHETNGTDINNHKDIDDTDSDADDCGKWYHISDSSVSLSSINSVLHSQAYILFYERIS